MEYKVFESMAHPIRMKIIQEVLKREKATVKDIAETLNDVPPASLYRHINRLLDDNILEIAAENKIRGTLEKVYKIKINPYEELDQTIDKKDPEQFLSLFYHFTMTLMSDFQNYLGQEKINLESDGVGFRSYPLYLTDKELDSMLKEIRSILTGALGNKPSPGRKLRKFSTVLTPVNE